MNAAPPFDDDYFDSLGDLGSLAEPAVRPQATKPRRFTFESFDEILFDAKEEWCIKRFIPKQGVGALYGKSRSFKSFVASDLGFHIALGWDWAGRAVTQAEVIYIAAEGAAGLRKRKAGFAKAHGRSIKGHVPFHLLAAAPNLGTGTDDLRELIGSVDASAIKPGLIVLDTLAQALGSGDENGAGMIQLVANATALANRFRCFVLIIHHVGLGDDQRLRGHTSLIGAIDMQAICERKEGTRTTVVTLKKLKDEDDVGTSLEATLERIVIGEDSDGDEISTLFVSSIGEAQTGAPAGRVAATVARSQRLLVAVFEEALGQSGETFNPGPEWPAVRAVADHIVRDRYYARIAEGAAPGEGLEALKERQRRTWNRTIKKALDERAMVAAQRNGERVLWLP